MSSSSQPEWIYDVFLSFRGEDTRASFTSHLYTALSQAGILTFKDDKGLRSGEEISASLKRAIEGSRIAIIVFSENYASSSWCLVELARIIKCSSHGSLDRVVIPVFYRVDPADVRHQTGSYSEAMERHEQRFGETDGRALRWRYALTTAANLPHCHFSDYQSRNESELIENIVRDVSKKLDSSTHLFVADYPVGVESRVHELTSQIIFKGTSSQDVVIVGIWGTRGLGKTTLAKAIYNEIAYKFQWSSFLANIRQVSKEVNGLLNLQNQLIYDTIKPKILKIDNIDRGRNIIRGMLSHKKELIVLDDVDSWSQLEVLCGSREWFGPGSVIIITTRDEDLLNNSVLKADFIYRMKEMNESESSELFSWHAFKQATPLKNFVELSQRVVAYSRGFPLTLETFGCHLFDREIEEWKSVLYKLETIPIDEIQAMLRL